MGVRRKKWNIEALKREGQANEYQNKIEGNLANGLNTDQSQDESIQGHCDKIKESILSAVENTTGEARDRRIKEWFDDDCRAAIQEKNRDRQQTLKRNTRATYEKYRTSKRNADKIIKGKKREFLKSKIKEIEQLNKANESKRFYHALKVMTNGYGVRVNTIRDVSIR